MSDHQDKGPHEPTHLDKDLPAGDDVNTEAVSDEPSHAQAQAQGTPVGEIPGETETDVPDDPRELDSYVVAAERGETHPDSILAAERLSDLQRLQAEYVNYRKRVERDRALSREQGIAAVLEGMLPALDDIHMARQHGDLEGTPFAAIADKLTTALQRFGITELGEPGTPFDPQIHEALMHVPADQADLPEGASGMTVVQVLQPGWRIGERVVRPARVSVADPD